MAMKITREQIEAIPEEIRSHLRKLIHSTDLPDNDESFELLASSWIEKEKLFSGQTAALDMIRETEITDGDERGMLLLTSSGSLLSLWPEREGTRDVEYASISLRSDVPEILKGRDVHVGGGLRCGSPVEIENGPLKKTSPVYLIAVCDDSLSKDEQEKRVREATIFLTNGFTRINKKTRTPENRGVDHFNKQSMVAYIAQRNGLTQKEVRQVVDDYLSMVESGVLLGESVKIGRLGRISVKVRPPQKARVGRNPATGEEITIAAKPAQGVPKMSFSTHIKERAAEIDVEEQEDAG